MVTLASKTQMYLESSAEVTAALLTLSGNGLTAPIRLCDQPQGILSRGQVYQHYPFRYRAPTEDPETSPAGEIEIDNVDPALLRELELLTEPLRVTAELVSTARPDAVDRAWTGLTLARITYDQQAIRGSLTLEDPRVKQWPVLRQVPAKFPGAV
jgi:hypothetical protein